MLAVNVIIFLCCSIPFLISAKEPNHDIKAKKEALVNTSHINMQELLEIIENHLKAIRAHDIEKAYNDTSIEFRKKVSLEDYKNSISKSKPLSNNKLFQFQSFYTEDDIATFGGELYSIDGEYIPVEYDLILQDGKWKILGIQIYKNEYSQAPE
jgi:hypothetical protein